MTLVVEAPGPLTLVQDAGRPGRTHLAISTGGAFDRRALRQANTVVGNAPDAAILESLGGGLVLRATADHVVAITGAAGPVAIDGVPAETGAALHLPLGASLRLGEPVLGLRWTVAVAGGIDVAPVLGSRSRDTLARLGPEPIAAGDVLRTGRFAGRPRPEVLPAYLSARTHTIGVALGPREDWFTPSAIAALLATGWVVDPVSDRIGIRLQGPALARHHDEELSSEPVIRGSIQVTSSGRPVILGPDHPVTGGYPVIGVVADAQTDRLAQVRPGDTIRFDRLSLP